jgi:hypothetical protein
MGCCEKPLELRVFLDGQCQLDMFSNAKGPSMVILQRAPGGEKAM